MYSKRTGALTRAAMHIPATLLAIIAVGACGPGDSPVVSEALLRQYHNATHAPEPPKVAREIDCYVDYSFGMGEGMRATAAINDKLKNFLVGQAVTYYRVGASEQPPVIDVNSPAGNFVNLDNFKEPASKLKVAVDRMTAHPDRVSLFVTDFERVEDGNVRQRLPGAPAPHPIDASAWAQKDFKEWLLAGNQIDVFAKRFTKPDFWFDGKHAAYPNWIYTVVFTPGSIVRNPIARKASLVTFLADEYRNVDPADSRHFTYTTNGFTVGTQGEDSQTGAANDDVVAEQHITDSAEHRFEFYEFKSKELVDFNSDAERKDKRVLRKVTLAPDSDALADAQYGIRVYDATQSLSALASADSAAPEQVDTNPETGAHTVRDKSVAPKTLAPRPDSSTFDFVYNTDTKEIGIKLKPGFGGVPQTTLYQVDVVLRSATPKDFTEADSVLALNYGRNYKIRSLGESVKLALRDALLRAENQVLYTFYVQIDK